MAEKHYRSIFKAFTWRGTACLDTLIISFIVTHRLKWAFTITAVELFTKLFLYYLHERIWNKILLGKQEEAKA